MKLIFISGPSGSGKTTLSNKIIEKIKNGIVLNTDNYYKTGLISKLISRFVESYFDRSISFNCVLLKKDFNFILKNRISFNERSYDFEKKTTKKSYNKIQNINFLIIEGIFAKEFSSTLCYENYSFLELKINKIDCMRRVIQRDFKERGKTKKQAENDFLKSWDIYYKKMKNISSKNNIKEIIVTNENNIDQILKKIFN